MWSVRINKIKDWKNYLEFLESQNCYCLLPWWRKSWSSYNACKPGFYSQSLLLGFFLTNHPRGYSSLKCVLLFV